MADGDRYRRRRHAVFAARPKRPIVREKHQPHFQAIDYNPLNDGIARWFEPIDPVIGAGSNMTTILTFCQALFESLASASPSWHIETHQFRIEARSGEAKQP